MVRVRRAGPLRGPDSLPPILTNPALPTLPVGGRLQFFWRTWQQMGASPYVVDIIREGYLMPFLSDPPLSHTPLGNSLYSDPVKNSVLHQAVMDLVSKRAIELVSNVNSPGFYSRLFLVPKKTGEWRPVIDLSALNRFIECPTFKMETPEFVRTSLQTGMWASSIDLKDAYLHVPIHPRHRKYLRFQARGVVYQFRALPFGLCTAPRLFTKLGTEVKKMGAQGSFHAHQYIDDWLVKALTRDRAEQSTKNLVRLLERLGWLINVDKSELSPSQVFEFLGYRFNLATGMVFPTEKRFQKILNLILSLLEDPNASPRVLMRVLGLLESTARLVPLGRLHMRPIQRALAELRSGHAPLDTVFPLAVPTLVHLKWWTNRSHVMAGVPLHPPSSTLVIFTDASLEGWGAHCASQFAQGSWSPQEQSLHINVLEMKAVLNALQAFSSTLKGNLVQVATDNSTVVAYINKQGGTKSWELCALLWRMLIWCQRMEISLTARHIPGSLNVIADQLSRKGQALHTEWSLHPRIFHDLCLRHGTPTIDLFATRFNHKLPLFVSPVPDPLCIQVDALSMDWAGKFLYAFPPVGFIPQVLAKLMTSEECKLLLIAPHWPTRTWFLDLCQRSLHPPVPLPQVWYLLKQPDQHRFHQNLGILNLHAWWLRGGQSQL